MPDNMAGEILLFHRLRVRALVPMTERGCSGTNLKMVVVPKVAEYPSSVSDDPFIAWTAEEIKATLIKAAFIAIMVLSIFDICLIGGSIRRRCGRLVGG